MENLKLTDGQQQGLELARRIAAGDRSIGLIKGYAGTGKTTLLKVILEEMKDIVLLAPTGKAASRITEVTGVRGSTAHRWMYKVEEHPVSKEPIFMRKGPNEYRLPDSNLVIVDEASMVGPDVYQDLIELQVQLGFNLLFIGDGFQLPPVTKGDEPAFDVLTPGFIKDFVELREITRQALDSPIIRATMAIRTGDPLEALSDMDIVMPEDLDDRLSTGRDMVICFKNATRHVLNERVRRNRNLGDLQIGEPLLILKNNKKLDIYNGEVHSFGGWIDNLGKHQLSVFEAGERKVIEFAFSTAALNDKEVVLCKDVVMGKHDGVSISSIEKGVSYWLRERELEYVHANLGYVLTCHKAQGSEADNVLVALESAILRNLCSVEGRRWLYTATTRSKKELLITYL